MVAECAYLLAEEPDQLPKRFGVITPAVAFGEKLKDRLVQKGVAIEIRAWNSPPSSLSSFRSPNRPVQEETSLSLIVDIFDTIENSIAYLTAWV